MPDFVSANGVLLTSSFGSEVETRELIAHALANGKTLFLPLVNKGSRMLELFAVSEPESQLARGTYGIAEPRVSHSVPAAPRERWRTTPPAQPCGA